MSKIAPYMKALVGAAVAGLGTLQQALDDGTVTSSEWVAVAVAFVSAAVAVFYIPYRTTATPPDEEGGNVSVVTVCAVIIAGIAVLWLMFDFLPAHTR